MKLRYVTALGMALALLGSTISVSAMSGAAKETENLHPAIAAVKGSVTVRGADSRIWEEVGEGTLLLSGDTLRTGKGSYARIEFPSGELEIYETTVVVIPSVSPMDGKKDIRKVVIEEGKTLFDINPLGVKRGFEFKTRNIQGGVKGTLFTVSYLEGGTAVNVYRGVVDVSDPGGSMETRVKLNAGKSMRVDGKPDFGRVKSFDPSNALKEYKHKIPPGLNEKGLPADYNANPEKKCIRTRRNEFTDSTGDVSVNDSDESAGDDQGDDDDGDKDDQGDNEQ